MTRARAADEAAQADDLLAQLKGLRTKEVSILLVADRAGDYRTALADIREARSCLALLAEMEGELNRRPVVNLLLAPEWLAVRGAIVRTLAPFPRRAAVAGERARLEARR